MVLHPPVDVDRFTVGPGGGDYFFIASRLLPYKRLDLAIRAAQMAGVRLLIAGTGPAESALRESASTTTTMLGFVDDAMVNDLLGAARAAILPGRSVAFSLKPLRADVRRSGCAAARSKRSLKDGPANSSMRPSPNRLPPDRSMKNVMMQPHCATTPKRSRRAALSRVCAQLSNRLEQRSSRSVGIDPCGAFESAFAQFRAQQRIAA